MAITVGAYGYAPQALASKQIDWVNDTVKVSLLRFYYTPQPDYHAFYSDVAPEVFGTGYTAGGKTLVSKTVTYDYNSNTSIFGAANVVWPASEISARYAIWYVDSGDPSTSPLIGWWNFGTDQVSSSGSFTLTIGSGGVFRVTAT